MQQYAVKTLVPEKVYTDRQEFIEYFYKYALEAVERRSMSTAANSRPLTVDSPKKPTQRKSENMKNDNYSISTALR